MRKSELCEHSLKVTGEAVGPTSVPRTVIDAARTGVFANPIAQAKESTIKGARFGSRANQQTHDVNMTEGS
jgi:hypothetical protein